MDQRELNRIMELFQQMDYTAAMAVQQGNLDDAALAYEQLISLQQSMGLTVEAARNSINLSNVRALQGDFRQALELTDGALAQFRQGGSVQDVLVAGQVRCRLLCALKQSTTALREAEQLLQRCKTDRQRGEVCLTLTDCCVQAGQRMKARNAVDRAVRWMEACGEREGLICALRARVALFESWNQAAAAAADRARLRVLESEANHV